MPIPNYTNLKKNTLNLSIDFVNALHLTMGGGGGGGGGDVNQ